MPARIAPDLNFLTPAHCQGSINVDPRIFSLEVLLLDLSVTTRCGVSKASVPLHNIIAYR
jgi:hypothetical protein